MCILHAVKYDTCCRLNMIFYCLCLSVLCKVFLTCVSCSVLSVYNMAASGMRHYRLWHITEQSLHCMTVFHVRHHGFLYGTLWLVCDITVSCIWHHGFLYMTLWFSVCDITIFHIWHHRFLFVARQFFVILWLSVCSITFSCISQFSVCDVMPFTMSWSLSVYN